MFFHFFLRSTELWEKPGDIPLIYCRFLFRHFYLYILRNDFIAIINVLHHYFFVSRVYIKHGMIFKKSHLSSIFMQICWEELIDFNRFFYVSWSLFMFLTINNNCIALESSRKTEKRENYFLKQFTQYDYCLTITQYDYSVSMITVCIWNAFNSHFLTFSQSLIQFRFESIKPLRYREMKISTATLELKQIFPQKENWLDA